MKSTTLRGGAAVVATAALALGLGAVPPASAAVIPTPTGADRAPATVGAAYLAAQRGADNVLQYAYEYPPGTINTGPDYGLTIDAATALDAVGGQTAVVTAMTSALEANIDNYVFSGGGAAKMSAFLLREGRSGAAVDGVVQTLEDHIRADGRLYDDNANSGTDYETPLTQGFAAEALHSAGSADAQAALAFLLQQQCSGGFFRTAFSGKADSAQSCDLSPTGNRVPSVDTTALVVLALQSQKAVPAVATSLNAATAWLITQQAADGSYSSGNANATGLAGWALGVSGQTAAAAKAASWLRAHQLANAGACTSYAAADNGAIVLDDLGLANAKTGPLDAVDRDVATRATAQALPALLWAAGGTGAGETTLTAAEGFVKAGSTQGLAIAAAPGNTLCLTQGTTHTRLVVPASGTLTVPITLPAGTGTTTIGVVDAGGESDTASYSVLGEKSLRFATAKKLHRGDRATIKVKGLAGHEKVRVYLSKKLVDKGRANADGVFKARFTVKHKLGKAKLKVLGQFATRSKVKKIRVVR